MKRSSWIIRLGPKSNGKYSCEGHTEERLVQRRGGGNVTLEAAMGVIQPQAQETLRNWKRQ